MSGNSSYVEDLKDSFIYNASLGSKELFHSNIWAWILTNEKFGYRFFNSLFERKITEKDIIRVKREEKNRDLTIYINEKEVYVIENKLKSIPYKEQLIKYQGEININEAILTGIGIEPLWLNDEELDKWKFKNYCEIANGIEGFAKYIDDDKQKYLIDYAQSIKELSFVLSDYYDSLNYHLPLTCINDKYKSLEELRIWDLAQKYVANMFANELVKNEDYIKIKNEVNSLKTEVGFHNGKYTFDCRIEKGVKENYRCIGVQIEGEQYRRTLQLNNFKEKGKGNDIVFKKGKDFKWFASKIKNKTINFNNIDRKTSITKDFCSYSTNVGDSKGYYYCFVYQYWNLDKDNSSFDNLIKCILDDIKIAKELIDKI